jgi:hypothetical protein
LTKREITPLRHRTAILGLLILALLPSTRGWPELAPGSMDVHWNEGSPNCAAGSEAPLEVHPYNDRTFILRENVCATFEAPFLYLLVGS